MPENADMTPGLSRPDLVRVLESAARLQAVLADAILVGGSAAALWAGHRTSFDHDHVLADLNVRFDTVLEAIEATEGWVQQGHPARSFSANSVTLSPASASSSVAGR